MTRALYVSPMHYGANAAVDAVAHGLESRLTKHGIELRVAYADFADAGWEAQADAAIRRGVDTGTDAVIVWVIDPGVAAAAADYARGRGVAMVTLERPHFGVDASVVFPNFNQGVYMSEYLATLIPVAGRVAVIGGPDVVDDIELMIGLVHGLRTSGLTVVNDPENPRYKNVTDLAPGGHEMTANVLADFPQLDGLIPYNDETMLGAVEALRDAGRLGEVKMVSRNGTPAAVDLIRQGIHHGTWDIDGPGIGQAVADLVARAVIDREDLDGLCLSSPVGRMITPERAKAWIPWSERIPYNTLESLSWTP